MVSDRMRQVESYAKETMATSGPSVLAIAHDFKHVDRVRNWALKIAAGEGFQNLELLQIAALLHDIGLPHTEETNRGQHGPIAAEMAADFLAKNNLVTDDERALIVHAIRHHNAAPSVVAQLISSDGKQLDQNTLLRILRDADNLDALGAVGLMRAFTSKAHLPDYDPQNIKGDAWGMSGRDFDESRAAGWVVGQYIVDQINFQMIFFDNLHTKTAKTLAAPLVDFMRSFVIQMETEIL